MDNVIIKHLSNQLIDDLVNTYQTVGKKKALEFSNLVVKQALHMQKQDENKVLLNMDATNAFNAMDSEKFREILQIKSPVLSMLYYINIILMLC